MSQSSLFIPSPIWPHLSVRTVAELTKCFMKCPVCNVVVKNYQELAIHYSSQRNHGKASELQFKNPVKLLHLHEDEKKIRIMADKDKSTQKLMAECSFDAVKSVIRTEEHPRIMSDPFHSSFWPQLSKTVIAYIISRPMKCPKCLDELSTYKLLQLHYSQVHQRPYTDLKDADPFTLLLRNNHRTTALQLQMQENKKKDFVSSKSFVNPWPYLPIGAVSYILKNPLICPSCSIIIPSFNKLQQHYLSHLHGGMKELLSMHPIDLVAPQFKKDTLEFISDMKGVQLANVPAIRMEHDYSFTSAEVSRKQSKAKTEKQSQPAMPFLFRPVERAPPVRVGVRQVPSSISTEIATTSRPQLQGNQKRQESETDRSSFRWPHLSIRIALDIAQCPMMCPSCCYAFKSYKNLGVHYVAKHGSAEDLRKMDPLQLLFDEADRIKMEKTIAEEKGESTMQQGRDDNGESSTQIHSEENTLYKKSRRCKRTVTTNNEGYAEIVKKKTRLQSNETNENTTSNDRTTTSAIHSMDIGKTRTVKLNQKHDEGQYYLLSSPTKEESLDDVTPTEHSNDQIVQGYFSSWPNIDDILPQQMQEVVKEESTEYMQPQDVRDEQIIDQSAEWSSIKQEIKEEPLEIVEEEETTHYMNDTLDIPSTSANDSQEELEEKYTPAAHPNGIECLPIEVAAELKNCLLLCLHCDYEGDFESLYQHIKSKHHGTPAVINSVDAFSLLARKKDQRRLMRMMEEEDCVEVTEEDVCRKLSDGETVIIRNIWKTETGPLRNWT